MVLVVDKQIPCGGGGCRERRERGCKRKEKRQQAIQFEERTEDSSIVTSGWPWGSTSRHVRYEEIPTTIR